MTMTMTMTMMETMMNTKTHPLPYRDNVVAFVVFFLFLLLLSSMTTTSSSLPAVLSVPRRLLRVPRDDKYEPPPQPPRPPSPFRLPPVIVFVVSSSLPDLLNDNSALKARLVGFVGGVPESPLLSSTPSSPPPFGYWCFFFLSCRSYFCSNTTFVSVSVSLLFPSPSLSWSVGRRSVSPLYFFLPSLLLRVPILSLLVLFRLLFW